MIAANKGLKIGFIDELYLKDGKTPSWGMEAYNGFKLAIGENEKFNVVAKDVGFSPIKAKVATDELVKKGTDLVIGLRIANQAMTVSKITNKNKIPYISIMATPDQLFKKGERTFSMVYRNSYQVKTLVDNIKYKIADTEVTSFVTQDCFYCVTIEQELSKQLKAVDGKQKRGGTLLHRKPVDSNSISIDSKDKVVAIFTDEVEALSLIETLNKKGFTGTLIGGDSWSIQTLNLKKRDDILDNICLINSLSYNRSKNSKLNLNFKKKYLAKYGKEPSDLAALGHDIGLILKSIYPKCATNKDIKTCLTNKLYSFKGSGVTGQISFESDGGRKKENNDLYKIGKCI